MTLHRILDPLAARLAGRLDDVRVDDVAPAAPGDLPCVVLSLADVTQTLVGVGRIPRGTRTGALRLSATVDLADPVLDLGNGESLDLLSADRRTLTLPHGPLVRADGTREPPFAAGDMSADDGEPFAVVPGTPTGRQVRADPVDGTLLFGAPLASAGELDVTYHVGQWDVVVVSRAQGSLSVEVVAADAGAAAGLSRAVASVLADSDPSLRATPVSWHAVHPGALPDDTATRAQVTTYRVDAEVEEPLLTSSGGVISRVAVTGALGPTDDPVPLPIEPFTVMRGEAT